MKNLFLLKGWETHTPGTIVCLEDDDDRLAGMLVDGVARYANDEELNPKTLTAEDVQKMVDQAISSLKNSKASDKATDTKAAILDGAKAAVDDIKVKGERIDKDPKRGFKTGNDFYRTVIKAGTGDSDSRSVLKASGMSEGVDADGGFLVPPEYRADLMMKVWEESPILPRVTRISVSSNSVDIPYIVENSRADGSRHGGIQVFRTGEGQAGTATNAQVGKFNLKMKKLFGLTYLTEELLSDAVVNIEQVIGNAFAQEMAFTIVDEILNGAGGNQMMGLLNANCLITETRNGAELDIADIARMMTRLPTSSYRNAVWIMHPRLIQDLIVLKLDATNSSEPIFLRDHNIGNGLQGTLMGFPVVFAEQCADRAVKGDVYLADLSQYIYAEHTTGMQEARSIHVKFTTDETALRWTMRNDGAPWWKQAVTPANGSTTISPFITLPNT